MTSGDLGVTHPEVARVSHSEQLPHDPTSASAYLFAGLILMVAQAVFVVFALARGPDLNFDWINVKFYSAWTAITGGFEVRGLSSSRLLYPPLHDGFMALLENSGPWWIRVAVTAIIQSLQIPIVFVILRRIDPQGHAVVQAMTSTLALFTPLSLMQAGASLSHLIVGLVLLLALREAVNSQADSGWGRVGVLLGVASVVRLTTVTALPLLVMGLAFVSRRSVDLIRMTATAIFTLTFVGFSWSAFVSVRTEATGVPPIAGLPNEEFGLLILVLSGVVTALMSTERARQVALRVDTWRPVSGLSWLRSLIVLAAVVSIPLTLRRNVTELYELSSLNQLFGRLVGTSNFSKSASERGLEYVVFDNVVAVMTVCMVAAVLLVSVSGLRRSSSIGLLHLGIVLFGTAPVIGTMLATGYLRYSTSFIATAPVVLYSLRAIVRSASGSVVLGRSVLALGVALLALPVFPGLGPDVDIPRFGATGGDRPLLSQEDLLVLNSLLPQDARVYAFGTSAPYLAAKLSRGDLSWEFREPDGSVVPTLVRPLVGIYDPATPEDLGEFPPNGIEVGECWIARLSEASYGICDLSVMESVRAGPS